jgi:hypothetical protein
MHLDRDALERMHRGPAEATERIAAEDHLSRCQECRERFEEVQLFSLFEVLDDPVPDVTVDEVIARAGARRVPRAGRWAAAIVLTFGAAGALYAAPGSPVPEWIRGLRSQEAMEEVDAGLELPDRSGVVVSVGARLVIELEAQTVRTIGLRLVDGPDVTVETLNTPATFDSRADRLTVRSSARADYRVAIPRDAPSVEVRVADRSIFALRNGVVTTSARQDGPGSYSIDIGGTR